MCVWGGAKYSYISALSYLQALSVMFPDFSGAFSPVFIIEQLDHFGWWHNPQQRSKIHKKNNQGGIFIFLSLFLFLPLRNIYFTPSLLSFTIVLNVLLEKIPGVHI